MHRRIAATLTICCVLPVPQALCADAPDKIEEVIVTASGWMQERADATSTVRVIGANAIEKSSANSVTDLLTENSAGFFSEWTPAQTSINIRGGASDGQGRDFRSQVLVLVDGRRARHSEYFQAEQE